MRLARAAMFSAVMAIVAGEAIAQTAAKPGGKPGTVAAPAATLPPGAPAAQSSSGDLAPATAILKAQPDAAKDARADRGIAGDQKAAALAAKNGKLAQDNASIANAANEAKEKAGVAMDGASTSLATGILQGSLQVGGGAAASNTYCEECPAKPKQK